MMSFIKKLADVHVTRIRGYGFSSLYTRSPRSCSFGTTYAGYPYLYCTRYRARVTPPPATTHRNKEGYNLILFAAFGDREDRPVPRRGIRTSAVKR